MGQGTMAFEAPNNVSLMLPAGDDLANIIVICRRRRRRERAALSHNSDSFLFTLILIFPG